MEIGREAAKQMFRDDKNSQGCYRSVMTKIDKVYDSIDKIVNEKDNRIETLEFQKGNFKSVLDYTEKQLKAKDKNIEELEHSIEVKDVGRSMADKHIKKQQQELQRLREGVSNFEKWFNDYYGNNKTLPNVHFIKLKFNELIKTTPKEG